MTVAEIMQKLETLRNDKVYAHNKKFGAHDDQFGVKLGDIRNIAKPIKTDHQLALALWATGNVDARFLATLIVSPAKLSADEIDDMLRSETFTQVADWFYNYVIKEHTDKEKLRVKWMQATHPMAARIGWSLTSGRVNRDPEGIDIPALLDRIENEMPSAPPEVQWTMNTTLAQIGINHAGHRDRALSIGEKLGIYRNYPVSKGCTSPFVPIWINEMVKRKG